jgi:hypothetical protein
LSAAVRAIEAKGRIAGIMVKRKQVEIIEQNEPASPDVPQRGGYSQRMIEERWSISNGRNGNVVPSSPLGEV